MQTTATGNNEETCTSYPFGDGLNCTGASPDSTEQHFTGKERDAESGLDYFFARYYSSGLARFLTPDWAAAPTAVPYATFGDPQTLNLYAYVNNNPNTGIDVNGHVGPDGQPNWVNSAEGWSTIYSAGDNGGSGTGQSSASDDTSSSTPPSPPDSDQQQIHTETTIVVRANTHWWNRLGSWLSNGFASLSAVFSRSFGSFGGARAGKPFTPAGKRAVISRNAAENGGQNVCDNCGQPTIPAQQSQAGVPRPGNETNVDHTYPRSLGGDGDPSNGGVLCATCNGIKSDSLPVMEEPEVMPEIPIEIPLIP